LLGRTRSPRPLEALAARSCRQSVTEGRHDQAPELPGQAGGRPSLGRRDFTSERNGGRNCESRPSGGESGSQGRGGNEES
jgi:hypothetical protein